jgi:hypothetical protein
VDLLHAVNLASWDLHLYFPSEGRCAADFYHPLKSVASAGFEPVTIGSSGKHTNQYMTEANVIQVTNKNLQLIDLFRLLSVAVLRK